MLLRKQMEVHGNILFKYRGELPILLIPPGVYLLYRAITTHPQFDWQGFLSWYKFLCLGIVALGQMIRGYAHAHTALHTSGRNIHGQLANAVNNTGIYSVVRHPLYLGNYFMALGVAMLSCNVWFVVVYTLAFWIYYERIIYAEEHFISQKFDAALEEWAAKTSTFFPDFSTFRKPASRFNWRKIIRNEKNGVMATFAIFFVYDAVEKWTLHGTPYTGVDFWVIALPASVVYYLVVRYLYKKTKLLAGE